MPETKECPKCGIKIDTRGLHSHKNSLKCRYRQKTQKQRQKGRTPVKSKKLKNWLKKQGHELYTAPTNYRKGTRNMAGHLIYGTWTDKENKEKAKENVLPGYTTKRRQDHYRLIKKDETEKYLIVEKQRTLDKTEEKLKVYRKDFERKTRKRVFLVGYKNDSILFDRKGERIGEKIDIENAPQEIKSLAIKEKL